MSLAFIGHYIMQGIFLSFFDKKKTQKTEKKEGKVKAAAVAAPRREVPACPVTFFCSVASDVLASCAGSPT